MISISMHKLLAIVEAKFKAMTNKNFVIMPLFSIGFTALMRIVYTSMLSKEEVITPELTAMVLNMGLTFNVCMTGMFVTSAVLAEEKEKHTLRTLMISSVTSMEFFLGSIIPPSIVIVIVNLVLLPVSGISMTLVNIPIFLLVTTIAGITSCIIGMILGIFAKNQMSASTISTPVVLIFIMLPIFSGIMPVLKTISDCLFTGVVSKMMNCFTEGKVYSIDGLSILVLLGEILISIFIFIQIYRRNGYEAD